MNDSSEQSVASAPVQDRTAPLLLYVVSQGAIVSGSDTTAVLKMNVQGFGA